MTDLSQPEIEIGMELRVRALSWSCEFELCVLRRCTKKRSSTVEMPVSGRGKGIRKREEREQGYGGHGAVLYYVLSVLWTRTVCVELETIPRTVPYSMDGWSLMYSTVYK
jgi:hypothetical protein